MKGKVTKAYDGFVATSRNPVTHLSIDGREYLYFVNNADEKGKIRDLQIGDMVNYEVKDSKGFPVLTQIEKVQLEVKELPATTTYPNWEKINQEKTDRIVKQVCLKIGSEHKTTPKEILKFAVALYNQIKETNFL